MSTAFLQQLREHELGAVIPRLPPRARLLEVGAGAGWQARRLAAQGYLVEAIDLPSGEYAPLAVWPVVPYDGHRIPFADATFDVVFSSNVLEHIPHVREFQSELRRVLAPGGLAVHIVPSGTWRAWTNLTYYAHVAVRIATTGGNPTGSVTSELPRASTRRSRIGALLPARHGEEGNCLSEVYLFSRFRWRRLFRSAGWTIVDESPAGLFYTGYSALGDRLSLGARRWLSRVLGSACRVFVLRRPA